MSALATPSCTVEDDVPRRASLLRAIPDHERRARGASRLGLDGRLREADPVEVARALVAVHATDPVTVFLSPAARSEAVTTAAVEVELYQERRLVRMLGMRRTMFVVPTDAVSVVQAACADAVAAKERTGLIALLAEAGVAKPTAWLDDVADRARRALHELGEATAAQLADAVPELQREVVVGAGTRWSTKVRISSRVLLVLAAEGHVVRGRPRGSWISTQYRWAPADTWLAVTDRWDPWAARAELVRRYLLAFGPVTADDVRWWTGWTRALAERALADVGAVAVTLDGGGVGLVHPDDVGPVAGAAPRAALLPALDAATMGWTGRAWYLGGHGPALFDRNGNAGPTVWWDGRVVGGWAWRADGELATRLLEDVGAEGEAAVEAEAARIAAWLGDVRFVPKFRTPLERELTG